MRHIPGGWGGIRTPGGVAPTTVFKTVAIDRSATHPKLFSAGLSNLRFCSLFAPGGAAHHSFALDCAALVLLTRMQDRRNRPLCHPSETFFRRSFKPTVLFAVRTWRCCSPLVRARLRCACLADSYARPSQSTAALTHPKLFSAGLFDKRRVLYSTNIPLSIYLFIILFLACIRNNVILHTNRREIEINKKAIRHV